MTPAGEKAAARLAVRQACAAVPAGVHAAASGSLCRALAALPQFAAAHTVAAFFGMGAEPGYPRLSARGAGRRETPVPAGVRARTAGDAHGRRNMP